MDRSFQSPLMGTKSPFSSRSRQNISFRKSLATPSLRKTSTLASGKSTQSIQVIMKTPYNYVERFGQPLPVLITEALTFAERNTIVSARISECGYAWVVCGRRLLIWQYKQLPVAGVTPQRKNLLNTQCFELQLPQSDLAHRAELVSVFIVNRSHSPSCIAVSPEGVLHYWPAVAHESVYIEQTVYLQGEECDSLTDVEGLGCILATTTCTVMFVQPQLSAGRHTLLCKPLRVPTGWLGGLSKRMSFIFGPLSSDTTAETRLVRVLSVPNDNTTWTIYVLAGHSLQKWLLFQHEPEQLVFVVELNRLVRETFQTTVWDSCTGGDRSDIDSWLLDIQPDKDGVIILAAAVNTQLSPRMHYAMMCLPTGGNQPPTNVKDFYLLKVSSLYREENPADCLSYRFLLCGSYAYLYNQKTIIIIKPQEEPDTLEFNSSQDLLLGGSVCVNTPIFFSKSHGLVAVSSNDLADLNLSLSAQNISIEASFNESGLGNNLSVYNMDANELYSAYTDTLSQMKAAFIFHIKSQQQAYQDIINELFPPETSAVATVDSVLDKIVIEMCKDLLDDIPAGDPRWIKDVQKGIGSSYAMQILHQLEDKQKALTLLVKFLKDSNLWGRLTAVTERDTIIATVQLIGEFFEKIICAIVLKSQPNTLILDNAIEKAAKHYDTALENGLTYQDVYFREVSKVHIGIQELVNVCEDFAYSDANPTQVVQHVKDTNDIILAVFKEVLQYRQANKETFSLSEKALSLEPNYFPWTIAPGSVGDSLVQQHSLTHNYGIKLSCNSSEKNTICEQFVALTDIILDGKKCHLESIKDTSQQNILLKQYSSDRYKMIKPLLQENEYEKAAQLAEKYLDFEALIQICEETNNQSRLDEYIERFNNDGFAEYVYNWYLRENKQGKLIDKCRKLNKTRSNQKLAQFVGTHPSLAWIQHIFNQNFGQAADILRKLAMEETESLTRQKTMYSLAKLSSLASPNGSENSVYIENINSQLEMIAIQEELPDYVLQEFGYNAKNPKVISPREMINLYICSEYKDAGELQFKKALDLLDYIYDKELKEELQLKIWRCAILRDSWNFKNIDSPLEILQSTLFFKLVDLSMILGGDPQIFLPPLDILIEDDSMKELQDNKIFQYLIKTGYEHVVRQSS